MSSNECAIKCCLADCVSSECHSIPCKVKATQEAQVNTYFNSNIVKKDQTNLLTNSFRGRPLVGCVLELPEDCVGIIADTTQSKSCLEGKHKFSQLTYWNWDQTPSQEDSIQQALQWVKIAAALHAPVDNHNN